MEVTLITLGVACAAAAIIGGGLEAAGMKIPAMESWRRQAMLFVLGLILFGTGMWLKYGPPLPTNGHAGPATTQTAAPVAGPATVGGSGAVTAVSFAACKTHAAGAAGAGAGGAGGDALCTLFVFDYTPLDVDPAKLAQFHPVQYDRLDKGIRNFLSSEGLLEGADVRVRRCSDVSIRDHDLATRAVAELNTPAVMWGLVQMDREKKQLALVTSAAVSAESVINFNARETVSDDLTLLAVSRELPLTPKMIGAFVIGDVQQKRGRSDLARRAFLRAKQLAGELEQPEVQFVRAVDQRLKQLDASNPAAALTPIGAISP